MHHNIKLDNPFSHVHYLEYRKHVTLYVREHPERFLTRSVVLNLAKLRLTVDTQEEYDKMNAMFTLMGDDPTWVQAVYIANQFPEFVSIETDESQTKALGKVW
jgi:spore coat polysaccharide biosynthesis protein SpsF (cytidylyltransferase family)